MIRYSAALELLESVAKKRLSSDEILPLDQAIGRILACDVLSPEDVPAFDNSSMDGFAVFSKETESASSHSPIDFRVGASIAAGDQKAYLKAAHVSRYQCVEIMTGAPIPHNGCDAVIKIEDITPTRDASGQVRSIQITQPVQAGTFIRRKGSDFKRGQKVLAEGMRFQAEHTLACASLGITHVRLKRLPRVAILSTGNELVSPSSRHLDPGMIRNSTGPFLVQALRRLGIEAQFYGQDYQSIGDDPALYQRTLLRALEEGAEIVISTGAVSMGKADFVSGVLADLGAKTHFHKVAIKPGKPILFAELSSPSNRAAFFGVPGNPISTVIGLRFFIEPYIRALLGLLPETPSKARLAQTVGEPLSKPKGLRCFYKALTHAGADGLETRALAEQGSHVVSSLLEANSWVVLPEDQELEPRLSVDVYPLQSSFEHGVLS